MKSLIPLFPGLDDSGPGLGAFPCIETRPLENCFAEGKKLGVARLFLRAVYDFAVDNFDAVLRSVDRFTAYPVDERRPGDLYQVHMEHYVPASGWHTRALLYDNVSAAGAVDILEALENKAQPAGPLSPHGPAQFRAAMGDAYYETRYKNLNPRDMIEGLVLLRHAPFIGEYIQLPSDGNRYVHDSAAPVRLFWTEDPAQSMSPALAPRTHGGTLLWPEAKTPPPERLIFSPGEARLRAY